MFEKMIVKVLQVLGHFCILISMEVFLSQDQLWRNQDSGLCAYSIGILNNVSYNVIEFAKSQV